MLKNCITHVILIKKEGIALKYGVENQLELNDSAFALVSFERGELIVSVEYLNIHKDSEPILLSKILPLVMKLSRTVSTEALNGNYLHRN